MQIFIMRHGEAQFYAASDEQRALTEKGRKDANQMALWLAKKVDALDLVLVSPYLRAQETWQCSTLAAKKVITENGITPYGDSEQVATYLKALISVENPSSILIVSHLPLVNYLAAEFDSSASSISFSTSAICQIEFDPKTEKSTLIEFQTPEGLK